VVLQTAVRSILQRTLDGPDGYRYYWKVDDVDPAIFSRDSNARSSVMVWGAFSKIGIFPLVAVPKKCDSVKYCGILEEGLTPYYNNDETFQQDGAPCHTSHKTRDFLAKQKIKTVPWPAKSPDLNPIENLWGWMVKDIYFGRSAFTNVKDLKDAVYASWARIPQKLIDSLVDSMPTRMRKVIEGKGKFLDY
jgi:hypothetical protein